MILDILMEIVAYTKHNSKHIFSLHKEDIYCKSKNKFEKFPVFTKSPLEMI